MEKDCLFCKIADGQTETEFIYEDDKMVVFHDIKPHAPVHVLLVPKRHIRSINDLTDDDGALISDLFLLAKEIAKTVGVAESGYKLLFNVEKGGGQVIFHIHLHLIGGWKR